MSKIIYTGNFFAVLLRTDPDFRDEVVKRAGYDSDSPIMLHENTMYFLSSIGFEDPACQDYIARMMQSNDFASGIAYMQLEQLKRADSRTIHINPMAAGIQCIPDFWKQVVHDMSVPVFVEFTYDEFWYWCQGVFTKTPSEEDFYQDQQTVQHIIYDLNGVTALDRTVN